MLEWPRKEGNTSVHGEIVCKSLEVFLKEFPGSPPDRKFEFTINLELGAAPISKVPYRMALKELQE